LTSRSAQISKFFPLTRSSPKKIAANRANRDIRNCSFIRHKHVDARQSSHEDQSRPHDCLREGPGHKTDSRLFAASSTPQNCRGTLGWTFVSNPMRTTWKSQRQKFHEKTVDDYYLRRINYDTCRLLARMVCALRLTQRVTEVAVSLERANPSQGELELLSVLWEHGQLSLSEVHERIGRDVGYTTIQTRLNRLFDKGWVQRTKTGKQPTQYAALIEPDQVRETQLDLFVEKVAQGSVVPLVAHLVQGASLTRDELTELKQLIRDAERRQQSGKEN